MTPHAQATLKQRYDTALRLAQTGAYADALTLLDGLALQAPKIPEIHFQRARLAAKLGDFEKRRSCIALALELRPNEPALLTEALSAFEAADDHDYVLSLFDRLIALSPKSVKPQADKALYLQQIGQFDQSDKLFCKLLKAHPTDAELFRMFAATHRFKPNDPLIAPMQRLAKHPKLTPQGAMHINFALAKAMEDTKQSPRVFPHLKRANAAQAKLWPDTPDDRRKEWTAVVDAQKDIPALQTALPDQPQMVFITGMPRSGTTLVEQIIGSHSAVQAGGEMATALRTAYAEFGAGTDMKPLANLAQQELDRFATKLGAQNRPFRRSDKSKLTDKSIMAFLIYGLLHATLPDARFIVVHRDPRDIAVSIYKNFFTGGTHRYANDLAAIADAIKSFRRIVNHWRSALPDRFYEVQYEDLVANPEDQSRALISAAGLDWEDACLRFHEQGGAVKTLSLHQVRKPIYRSSAQAWEKYETDLQPFFDAWGDTPWD